MYLVKISLEIRIGHTIDYTLAGRQAGVVSLQITCMCIVFYS